MTLHTDKPNFNSLIEKLVGLTMENIRQNDSTAIDQHIEHTKGITLAIGKPEPELLYRGNPILTENRIIRTDINSEFEKAFLS